MARSRPLDTTLDIFCKEPRVEGRSELSVCHGDDLRKRSHTLRQDIVQVNVILVRFRASLSCTP